MTGSSRSIHGKQRIGFAIILLIILHTMSGCASKNIYPGGSYSPPSEVLITKTHPHGIITEDISEYFSRLLVAELKKNTTFNVIEVSDAVGRGDGLLLKTHLVDLDIRSQKNTPKLLGSLFLTVTIVGIYPARYINTDEIYCSLGCEIDAIDLRTGSKVLWAGYQTHFSEPEEAFSDRGRIISCCLRKLSKEVVGDLSLHLKKKQIEAKE